MVKLRAFKFLLQKVQRDRNGFYTHPLCQPLINYLNQVSKFFQGQKTKVLKVNLIFEANLILNQSLNVCLYMSYKINGYKFTVEGPL
jgi:hypothetical protein